MSDVFFIDLFNHLTNQLKTSTKSLKIAVAWINFGMFYHIFCELHQKGVIIDIIVDDNYTNHQYDDYVTSLKSLGISVTFLKMPFHSTMHEKFCIIDNKRVLFGSYNWTNNATNNNFENLFITDDSMIVEKFVFEFHEIKDITYTQIFALQKGQNYHCYSPQCNICTIDRQNHTTSHLKVFTTIDGAFEKNIFDEYYDIGLYNSLTSIGEEIFDCYYIDETTKQSMYNFALHKFIVTSVLPLIEIPIHALAVETHELYHRNIEDIYYKTIWKNRFIANFISDRYEL